MPKHVAVFLSRMHGVYRIVCVTGRSECEYVHGMSSGNSLFSWTSIIKIQNKKFHENSFRGIGCDGWERADITGPVATGITGPVATDITGPVATDIRGPVATGITRPVATDITGPVATDITGPVATDIRGPVATAGLSGRPNRELRL